MISGNACDGLVGTHVRGGVHFNDVGRLFCDSDDRRDRMAADLVREDGCVDDAQALDAEHAQARVNDTSIGRGADARRRRLDERKESYA